MVLVTGACVGLPPPPPQGNTDGGTTAALDETTVAQEGTTSIDTSTASAGETSSGPEDTDVLGAVCGDGLVEGTEECDLGPLNGSGMFCTDECTANVCGDGYLGPGEACDDGNLSNEDLCTSDCGPASCGDGALQGAEQCDNGKDNAEDAECLPSCQLATCGDLFIHEGVETCDGSNDAGQTCASQGFDRGVLVCATDCMSFDTSNCHECGNGVIEPNEDCDGNQFGGITCASFAPGGTTVSGGALSCTNACTNINSNACTYCGDDTREGTELCDGTDVNGQTCVSQGFVSGPLGCAANCGAYDTSACETCGNGTIQAGEECDGANLNGGTCATVEGPGNIGPLACDASCNFDISGCCLDVGEPCTANSQCCSSDCSTTCQPA